MKKSSDCSFCDKKYNVLEDLFTHIDLEHTPISPKTLEESTKARETKKKLDNFMDDSKKGLILECPECYEPFSSMDRLNKHRKTQHNMLLRPEAEKKMKDFTVEKHPQCERCNLYYPSIITTKIERKMQFVCMDCYEKYWGTNALQRLTIGTPDETIDKIRKPTSKDNNNNNSD